MAFFQPFYRSAYRPASFFEEMELLKRRMDQLFGRSEAGGITRSSVFPAINITENKAMYFVRAELPGIPQNDLDIQASGNGVFISGERKIPAQEGVKYHRKEREAGKFSRAVTLPTEIDVGGIQAELKNGVLKITVPKAEKAKPRQIAVK
jgi:HSP20 family protein